MKKTYEKPQIKAIEIQNEQVLLTGSTPGLGKAMTEDEEFE